jgi:hypothetical protein
MVNVPEASSRSSSVIKVIKVPVNIKLHFFLFKLHGLYQIHLAYLKAGTKKFNLLLVGKTYR